MTLLIFPSGSSYTLSEGLVNSDVYSSTYCKNFLFFVCTYHKNSLQLFSKGQLVHEGGIWSFALLFMKVWKDLVYLLMFCQLCKLILVSVSLEIRPIYYIRNPRKWNFLLGGLLTVLLLFISKDGVIRVSRGREENTLLRI